MCLYLLVSCHIETDSNIVYTAKNELTSRFDANIRNQMNSTVNQYSEQGLTNVEEGIQKQIEDVSQRLKVLNPALYRQVREILDTNKSERHIRGGLATKKKYLQMKASESEKS